MNIIRHNTTENIVDYKYDNKQISLLSTTTHNFYIDIDVNTHICTLINRAETIEICAIQTIINEDDIFNSSSFNPIMKNSSFIITIGNIINNSESIFTQSQSLLNIFPLIMNNLSNIGGIVNEYINLTEFYYYDIIKKYNSNYDELLKEKNKLL